MVSVVISNICFASLSLFLLIGLEGDSGNLRTLHKSRRVIFKNNNNNNNKTLNEQMIKDINIVGDHDTNENNSFKNQYR